MSIQESCQIQDNAFVIDVPVPMEGYSWCDGWGFWHLSRFAQEYRHMFGEMPSETLRASLGETGGLLPERY